jgi:hypothetical protein
MKRWQRGDGFGDTARTIARYAIPTALAGAEKFGDELLNRLDKGEDFKSGAKAAIGPALSAALERTAEVWRKRHSDKTDAESEEKQEGSGRKRHRKSKGKKAEGKKSHKGVYKGAGYFKSRKQSGRGKKTKKTKKCKATSACNF